MTKLEILDIRADWMLEIIERLLAVPSSEALNVMNQIFSELNEQRAEAHREYLQQKALERGLLKKN